MGIPEGDYIINVSSNGQAADSPRAFTSHQRHRDASIEKAVRIACNEC